MIMARMLLVVAAVAGLADSAAAGRPETIRVQLDGESYTGRAVASNSNTFWLMQRDGQLVRLPVHGVKSFRKVSARFQAFRATEMRTRLLQEFGKDFEAVGTRYYLVVAPRGHGKKYADNFDQVCRTFITHFKAKGLRLDSLKFPLVAIVFPNRQAFQAYAKQDGVHTKMSILGYYHPRSNRVAVYDNIRQTPKVLTKVEGASGLGTAATVHARPAGPNPQLKSTIIHETTHQVAFNTGLHSRIGATPKWVVEGLATMFEAPGIRKRRGRRGAASRINNKWLPRFRKSLHSRKQRTLAAFVSGDEPFRATPLDAYAEAWALSFFLAETRATKYSKYLRILSGRDPLKPYYARDRLKDFQSAFGKDVDKLEVEFVRFINGLNTGRASR